MRISDWSSDVCSSDLAGQDAVAMRDLDHIAIAAALADETDLARCGGQDRLAHAARKIQARVKGRMAVERIAAIALAAAHHRRRRRLAGRDGEQARFQERSEERRLGTECVSTFRFRWSPDE